MTSITKRISGTLLSGNSLAWSFLLIIIFSYFLTAGRHVPYYQEKTSLFLLTSGYLGDYAAQPGGLLEWFSMLLTSLFYNNVAGAFILAIVIPATAILLQAITKTLTGSANFIFPLITAGLMFWLQTDYQYLFVNNLGIALQVSWYFCILRNRKLEWPAIVLFPLWYHITGGFAWIGFLMLVVHFVSGYRFRSWLKLSALFIITAVFLLVSGLYLFSLSAFTILTNPISAANTGNQLITFHVPGVLIILTPLFTLYLKKHARIIRNRFTARTSHIINFSLMLVLTLLISFLKYDLKTIQYFTCEKLFFEKKYSELIDFNLKNPSSNYLTIYLNNIALCETGQLNEKLFSFPQSPDAKTLFLNWEIVGEILRKGGYFYYTVGMINEAHRWAFEYMVMKGHNPEGLKMLIKTELINGNHETAEKYIDLLARTFFYRQEALRYRALLYNSEGIKKDQELGPVSKLKISTDFFTITDNPPANLIKIITADSLNRNAFEYLMAYYLITKDYKSVVDGWAGLARYGYKEIPRAVAEAGVAISNLYGISLPAVNGLTINPEIRKQFDQYLMTFQNKGANLKIAEPELRRNFGTTFWYWVFYR